MFFFDKFNDKIIILFFKFVDFVMFKYVIEGVSINLCEFYVL